MPSADPSASAETHELLRPVSLVPVMADDSMLDALDLASLELTAPAAHDTCRIRVACNDAGTADRPGDHERTRGPARGATAETLVADRLTDAGWTVLAGASMSAVMRSTSWRSMVRPPPS